ncbi:MAG: phosphoribosylformylglycinamidine synthase [Treponema sp.]|jgi:phosphoribosylformylglycinamidine synthase|nr:phosphoribosylformylglycinamidine synthase [Treponema sp.]
MKILQAAMRSALASAASLLYNPDMSVFGIYVEKRPGFAEEAASTAADLRLGLQLDNIESVRIIIRYFAEGISQEDFNSVKDTVFSEPPADFTYNELPVIKDARVFAVEYLPGQFDQRADSCCQCISLATGKERPVIHSAKIYAVYGNLTDDEFAKVKSWLINPVESREASLVKPQTLAVNFPPPEDIAVIEGFISLNDDGLEKFLHNMNLAMDLADIKFCQRYFKDEKRDPSVTEIRVLDTYWSDHCRHTTFLTELDEVQIEDEALRESYYNYLALRSSLGRDEKPVTLMDMATIGAKALASRGLLPDLDESEEINACSVKIKVDVDGKDQDWLLMFKNETHNHPTEIEPFGGAATCLGGAIRDPLSGRSFVYQAMRITGAGDPLQSAACTLPGKLPQRKICRTAAAGYSSYGNQIGLATGLVHEIYHPGYAAKRMEIGAVIGAAPAKNVIRKTPKSGDVVILLGGRTGRDGIGGATGSSKSHTPSSLETCGADVQKGNAPEERKLQRLFRNPTATRLIKRCNDFGAGGVSVSAGEIADGIIIDLDKIPKKYEGLDGTELAISESQERMSVVTAKKDADIFIALAANENLEATVIAEVTEEKRLVMKWNGKTIVNLSRNFLNSNGAKKRAKAHVGANSAEREACSEKQPVNGDDLIKFISGLNVCSQKGLGDRFDSCIGAATVVSPYGGRYQSTPAQYMAAKIPVLEGETSVCSLMSWGFDPEISSVNPYYGAVYAIVHSAAKIIAAGGSRRRCWLSFQEYFQRLKDDPIRWGLPLSALLGALDAQLGLEIAAIGGKDSMSGSYAVNNEREINVPPTLVSFAVSTAKIDKIVTPEFKKAGSAVYLLKLPFPAFKKPDFAALCRFFDCIENLVMEGKTLSVWAVGSGGTAEAVIKMCMGNHIGFKAEKELFAGGAFGGFAVEMEEELYNTGNRITQNNEFEIEYLGKTTENYILKTPSFEISFDKIQNAWEKTLESVYPCLIKQNNVTETFIYNPEKHKTSLIKENHTIKSSNGSLLKNNKPCFVIPVFPGTNSEYDTARAVEKAGGRAQVFVIRNLTPACIGESVSGFEKAVRSAQGIVFPGGFSGGDEPDGSGKFITAFIRNPVISDAVMELLKNRDGLICGICNGFQALVKLGLVPYGEIRDMTESSPTLTFNTIGRHQSTLANTRIVSNKSPWLSLYEAGECFIVPVSHGEGRFAAGEDLIRSLAAGGQIATQYADFEGKASSDIRFNPNNSCFSIEGITSPDGRVFGRMAHNERFDDGLYRNIPGMRKMDIFSSAVRYFK